MVPVLTLTRQRPSMACDPLTVTRATQQKLDESFARLLDLLRSDDATCAPADHTLANTSVLDPEFSTDPVKSTR